MAGPARALVPPAGAERRRVMQITAFALASMDRMQWAFYERRFKPEEKVHQPWIDHNESRSLAGLRHLEWIASGVASAGWLADTARMTQADITTAVVVGFVTLIRPDLTLSAASAPSRRDARSCLHSSVRRCRRRSPDGQACGCRVPEHAQNQGRQPAALFHRRHDGGKARFHLDAYVRMRDVEIV